MSQLRLHNKVRSSSRKNPFYDWTANPIGWITSTGNIKTKQAEDEERSLAARFES